MWIWYEAGESDVCMNVVVLVNTSDGGGIEAWVDMDEEDFGFHGCGSGSSSLRFS